MKKQAASWNIAATYYLTAGFAPGILLGLVFGYLAQLLQLPDVPTMLIRAAFLPALAAWLGVMYSVRYIHKTYVVQDAARVVALSTGYYRALHLGLALIMVALTALTYDQVEHSGLAIISILGGAILGLAVFHHMSKKLLTSDEAAASPVTPQAGSPIS